jgi:hypothetical protein
MCHGFARSNIDLLLIHIDFQFPLRTTLHYDSGNSTSQIIKRELLLLATNPSG